MMKHKWAYLVYKETTNGDGWEEMYSDFVEVYGVYSSAHMATQAIKTAYADSECDEFEYEIAKIPFNPEKLLFEGKEISESFHVEDRYEDPWDI